MEAPNVRNTIYDQEHDVSYHIMAYRQLSREEMLATVADYHSQPKIRRRKKRERNTTIIIMTSYGATANI